MLVVLKVSYESPKLYILNYEKMTPTGFLKAMFTPKMFKWLDIGLNALKYCDPRKMCLLYTYLVDTEIIISLFIVTNAL